MDKKEIINSIYALKFLIKSYEDIIKDNKDFEPLCVILRMRIRNLAIGIEALEKQIPKRPVLEEGGYDNNENIIYDTWICPNCEKHYEVDYDDYDFCPKCGQAIDRTDIEEYL